jgi:hypothetical protein
LTEIPGFTLLGAIRSKKTSQQIITIPFKGSQRCRCCGKVNGFPKLIPSDAHKTWHDYAMQQSLQIKAKLVSRGVALPIVSGVSVEAHFYQDMDRADAVGLYESLGDFLQDAGILANDKLIEDWDGSRRFADKMRPRVEVWLTVVHERAVQEALPLAQGDEPR